MATNAGNGTAGYEQNGSVLNVDIVVNKLLIKKWFIRSISTSGTPPD
jgi:hypothetical protein